MASKGIVCQLLLLMWYQLSRSIRVPESPCGNLFSYDVRPDSDQRIGGLIQIRDLNPNENVHLDLQLSARAWSTHEQKFFVHLFNSIDSTYDDIVDFGIAAFWIDFPTQSPLPLLISMSLNGKQICSGPPAQQPATTIQMTRTFSITQQSAASYNATSFWHPKRITLFETAAAVSFPAHAVSVALHTTAKPVTASSAPVKKRNVCGTNNLLTDISINGMPHNQVGQFPWAVPLFQRNSASIPEYFCGGTILTDRHILTAAHCVNNMRPEDILAIPGKYNISDLSAEKGAVHANVQQIVSHEDYDSTSEHLVDQDADIAILRLERSLRFTSFIKPICLWRNQNPLSVDSNQKGLVSGWGHTGNGHTNVPFYYTSTIVSKQQCGDNLGYSIPNRARLFCGDGSGSVACNGDSGSALAMKSNNRFYLRGVVSKAVLDEITLKCDTNKYVIYADVPKFIRWILKHIDDDDYYDY